MFYLFVTFVFLATVSLPYWSGPLLQRLGFTPAAAPMWLAWLAAALYIIANVVPDVGIPGETDTFLKHAIGGGLYATALFAYLIRRIGWRPNAMPLFLALFAWAAALGVINELFELALVTLHIDPINIRDTSWDLAANTTGTIVGYFILRATYRADKPDK